MYAHSPVLPITIPSLSPLTLPLDLRQSSEPGNKVSSGAKIEETEGIADGLDTGPS